MDKAKYKAKKYYSRHNSTRKQSYLDVNLKGFLCSCNNREKECIKEAYNLLNEYHEKLYKKEEPDDSGDISESLSQELEALKEDKKSRFQMLDSGAKNFLFIKTTLENPVEIASEILKDVHDGGLQKSRFLLRLIPVQLTCKANIEEICKTFVKLAVEHFPADPQTFSIHFNHRNNNVVLRDEVIKAVAEKVFELNGDHKVDLKNPKLVIIVEVIKAFAFLSIIPDYVKYKKFNLVNK